MRQNFVDPAQRSRKRHDLVAETGLGRVVLHSRTSTDCEVRCRPAWYDVGPEGATHGTDALEWEQVCPGGGMG